MAHLTKIRPAAILACSTIATFSAASIALAADSTGLDSTAKTAGLAGSVTTPETVVANIISGLLGFVGVLFLILMIYAGILWMTAQGNEEQVGKAKKLIASAVIGIIIVFSAYAITQFVLQQVVGSTSGAPTSESTSGT